jgi:hypothetical protein
MRGEGRKGQCFAEVRERGKGGRERGKSVCVGFVLRRSRFNFLIKVTWHKPSFFSIFINSDFEPSLSTCYDKLIKASHPTNRTIFCGCSYPFNIHFSHTTLRPQLACRPVSIASHSRVRKNRKPTVRTCYVSDILLWVTSLLRPSVMSISKQTG